MNKLAQALFVPVTKAEVCQKIALTIPVQYEFGFCEKDVDPLVNALLKAEHPGKIPWLKTRVEPLIH